MERTADLVIVGAGAAGLAAAIFAAERHEPRRIVVLDGAKTIGAKILVSGGGRCNVTHDQATAADFFGNRRIIKNVLAAFSAEDAVRWFRTLGVELKREETGKLFPVTDMARTVLNALIDRCRKGGVELLIDHRVTDIARVPAAASGFLIRHAQGTISAEKVILATGGRSLPRSGSDGSGYALAGRLGHHVTLAAPALVPLMLDRRMFHGQLSGLSQEVELTSVVEGKKVDRRTGSLLWTHFGISGPVVMDASRFWTIACRQKQSVDMIGNFFPGWTGEQSLAWFKDVAAQTPRRSLAKTLASRLPERFAGAICRHADCDPSVAIGQCSREDRDRLLSVLSRFRFPVEGDRGWNYAEVTAGGVPLSEIDFRTMESKVVQGLYLIGEILDCDGRIGGFNFQWAWATGYLAGRAATA